MGNYCLDLGTDGQFCSAECTADDGCGEGFICAAVRKGNSLTGRACVPENYSCNAQPEAKTRVIINEVLADPINGPDGDTNYDGWYHDSEDEFIELVNSSKKTIDISGWTVADAAKVRFTFPSGTTLKSGQAAVVFGGGSAVPGPGAEQSWLFVSDGLALANAGDSVILRNERGQVADRLVYGPEGGQDRSMNRTVDGSKKADFELHPGALPYSPGTTTDGSPF